MSLHVLKILNIFMMNRHTIYMKIIYSLIVYFTMLFIFVFTLFINKSILFSSIFFILYLFMIKQYYSTNHKLVEIKDMCFSIIYVFLVFLIYLLFNIKFSIDELVIFTTISFISIISYTCQILNQLLFTDK